MNVKKKILTKSELHKYLVQRLWNDYGIAWIPFIYELKKAME